METVEIFKIDLQYENYRMKNEVVERKLFDLINQKGILEPLQGITRNQEYVLLNGFKRFRCARLLNIKVVPYTSLGSDEAECIIKLIRGSNAQSLTILEQAKLIEELRSVHKMCVSEIAEMLERSKSWVSMRTGIINEMSPIVSNNIFSGKFPVYSYMYTLREFIRMNSITKEEIDKFVNSVSGKKLSIRQISQLAHSYFRGGDDLRQQIEKGKISWVLNTLSDSKQDKTDCTEIERNMLRELEIVQKYIQRVTHKSNDNRYKSKAFYAQANLLSGGILRELNNFEKSIRGFYDRTSKA
ncbi:MAG: chromosome partitioning protein ParB [Candidatus Brocadiales bacterium]|nr:chromosome partitioning protein ParB [Candidatus Brocadiales bacterium]